jgi:hypothetical protein
MLIDEKRCGFIPGVGNSHAKGTLALRKSLLSRET